MNRDEAGRAARRSLVARFVAGQLALGLVVAGALLLLVPAVSLVIPGWSSAVVTSGSMAPRIAVGDVIVVRRPGEAPLGPPSVILVRRDGAKPLLHRVRGYDPQTRSYQTQGDANSGPDSDRVPADSVLGVGRIAVPSIGAPLVAVDEGNWPLVLLYIVSAAAAVRLSRWALDTRNDPWLPSHSRHAVADTGSETGGRPPDVAIRLDRGLPRITRVWRRLVVGLVVAGLALAGGARIAAADSAFTGRSANTANRLSTDTLAPVTALGAATQCVAWSSTPSVVASSFTRPGVAGVTIPAETQLYDSLVLTVVGQYDNISTFVPTVPAGWTEVAKITNAGRFHVTWQRIAQPADAGSTLATASSYGAKLLIVVRGAGPVGSAKDGAIGYLNPLTAPSVSGVAGQLLLVVYAAEMGSGTAFSTPGGMTEVIDANDASGVAMAANVEALTSSGATGTRTSTPTNPAAFNSAYSLTLPRANLPYVDLSWNPTTSAYATGYEVWAGSTVLATPAGRAASGLTGRLMSPGSTTYTVKSVAGAWRAPATVSTTAPSCP